MNLMGFREYARHRGCTLRAVQKAIEDGRIKVTQDEKGRDKIDQLAADRDWHENTDPARQSVLYTPSPAGAGKDSPTPSAGAGGESDEDAPQPGDTGRYRSARAEREEIKRDQERLDLEVKRGSLIPLELVKRLAYTEFRRLRDGLLNLPPRLKTQLAATSDADAIEILLEAELSAVLSAFSTGSVTAEVADEDDEED